MSCDVLTLNNFTGVLIVFELRLRCFTITYSLTILRLASIKNSSHSALFFLFFLCFYQINVMNTHSLNFPTQTQLTFLNLIYFLLEKRHIHRIPLRKINA